LGALGLAKRQRSKTRLKKGASFLTRRVRKEEAAERLDKIGIVE
jgi:hypothetical protein